VILFFILPQQEKFMEIVSLIKVYSQEFISLCPWVTALFAFIIGYACMPLILKIAIRKGLVVKPNKRSSHSGRIPNIGGLNIFTSFLIGYLLCVFPAENSFEINATNTTMFATFYIIFLVGFIDDLLAISPKKKLFGELIATFILIVIADVRLKHFYGFLFLSDVSTGWYVLLSWACSAFLYLLIINAINLIDGVDGLATGIGMTICAFFGIYFQLVGEINLSIMAYTLIGSLAIFFIYNVFGGKYKIFMGDSGALLLGTIIYIFVIKFCEYNSLPSVINYSPYFVYAAPAVCATVLAIPLFDTLRVMITRVKKGKSPFYADKNHVHHLLLSLGFKHRDVTFILILVNISFIALAIIGKEWHNYTLGFAAIFLAIFYIKILWYFVDKKKMKNLKQ
jgi:UDP-N-acetylmuramyl pentapeptide phosphotransferase/UDP-N-acetylglucosamine-1-phosphate transferase